MKHLYFVRHGLSELNKAGIWSGQTETPLTTEGRDQSKLAGESAKSLNIDCIVSSPFSRAYDTAKIIADIIGIPEDKIERDNRLIERHFGSLEGQPWDSSLNVNDFADVETVEDLLQRAKLALDHLRDSSADNILLVSHGSFGRALRHVIDPDIPFDGAGSFPNAQVVQLL